MQTLKKISIIVVALMLQTTFSFALFSKSEDEKIWDRYVETKKNLEKDTHELVAKKWRNQKTLANEHLKLEMARLDKKDAQFEYLIKNHPERIDRRQGLDEFANFDWSDKDEAHLLAIDKKYAEKIREINRLEQKYLNVSGHSEFENNLQEVKSTIEYRSIEDRFKDMVAKLDVSWKNLKNNLKK